MVPCKAAKNMAPSVDSDHALVHCFPHRAQEDLTSVNSHPLHPVGYLVCKAHLELVKAILLQIIMVECHRCLVHCFYVTNYVNLQG